MYCFVSFLNLHRRSSACLAVLVVILTGVFFGIPGVDNSLEVWFVEDDPALSAYREFMVKFGNDEVVLTVLEIDEPETGIFSPASLGLLAGLSRAFENIEGVARVQSLTMIGGNERTSTGELAPEDVSNLTRIVANGPLASRLVTEDLRGLVIYTWMDASAKIDASRPRILSAIRAVSDSVLKGSNLSATHAGMGVMYDALNQATFDEGARFIGLSYLAIAIALFLVTRRLAWTVLAMLCIAATDVVLFGAMAAMDQKLNLITMALPALVMILGVSNIVHMSIALDEAKHIGRRATVTALTAVALPCLFNALTTACGFASLSGASMAITRTYGQFAALGVLLAFTFSLVAAASFGPSLQRKRQGNRWSVWLASLIESVMISSARRRGIVFTASAVVAATSIVGGSRIVVDTYSIDFLPKDHSYRRANARVEKVVGPYVPVEMEIMVPESTTWRSTEFLAGVSKSQSAFSRLAGVGASTSIVDILADLKGIWTGVRPPEFWTPNSDSEVSFLLGVAENSGGPDLLGNWVTDNGRVVRISVPVEMASAGTMVAKAEEIQDIVKRATGCEVTLAGYLPLYGRSIDYLVRDQVTSFSLAFVSVFLVVILILRSWRLTLAAIAPNLLPVGLILGVMGWSGIRLDMATVTIAAAVLGVIVDDTIHVLYRFRSALRSGLDIEDALRDVARTSGLAVVSTSLILCVGFGVLAACGVRSVSSVGSLIGLGVVSALLTDLILLPAIIAQIYSSAPERRNSRLTRRAGAEMALTA